MQLITYAIAFCLFVGACGKLPDGGNAPQELLPQATPTRPKLSGDGVGNGGGIGEKTVLLSYQKMPTNLDRFLTLNEDSLSDWERDLVSRVSSMLKANPPSPEQVVFGTPKSLPGRFKEDQRAHGGLLSAITGATPGATIWVNRHHLYRKSQFEQRVTPISVPKATGLLLDELAHHVEPSLTDAREHEKLDFLCSKLDRWMSHSEMRLIHRFSLLEAVLLQYESPKRADDLLIINHHQIVSVGEQIASLARCEGGEPTGRSFLWNPHWLSRASTVRENFREVLRVDLGVDCLSPGNTLSNIERKPLWIEANFIVPATLMFNMPAVPQILFPPSLGAMGIFVRVLETNPLNFE